MSMKNYVILLAGGVGKRMQTDIPKQFIVVEGRPIIVHTAERFQCNPQIESIVIVCVPEWIDNLRSLVEKYSLTKVRWIIEGGSTGHDSIRNGVFFLKDKIDSDDYIIVHDAVRPILPQKAIDEVMKKVMLHHPLRAILQSFTQKILSLELLMWIESTLC